MLVTFVNPKLLATVLETL